MALKFKSPLIVALDVDSPEQARALASQFSTHVGAVKVGPRLVLRDSKIIQDLAKISPVFVDLKFLDIPSTMESAVRAAFDCGATLVTVHGWAGEAALKRLADLEQLLGAQRPFKILVVTILTSFSQKQLPPPNNQFEIPEQIRQLTVLSKDCGLSGIVCSPFEVEVVKKTHPKAFVVTPGVRAPGDSKGDQTRTMSAAEAIRLGADAIVVGRPILESPNPGQAIIEIIQSLPG